MLRTIFNRIEKWSIQKGLMATCPLEDDDERLYGPLVDKIARKTSHNPAYIQKELEKWSAFNIDTSAENFRSLYDRYCRRHQINHHQPRCQM